MLLAMLLSAHADDLTWRCATGSAPVDVHVWSPDLGRHGAGDAGRAAYDLLAGRVDCLADCVGVEDTDCPARSCTTAAGDVVEWEASSVYDGSGYGGSSVHTVHVRVEPAAGAGLGWRRAEVTRTTRSSSESSISWNIGTSWSVAWDGVLDAAWPADGAFNASEGDSNEGPDESWADGACAWSSEGTYAFARVAMNGHDFQVYDPGIAEVCWGWIPASSLGGVAYVDGVLRGVVDSTTWEDAAGTDADGDGWTIEEGDCDDADPTSYCYATEIEGDGVDNDCNGLDGSDADGDGWVASDDCDDADPDVHPDAPDSAGDGVDSDCDGVDGAVAADTAGAADTGRPADAAAGAIAPDTPMGCGCAGGPVTRSPVGLGCAALAVVRRRSRARHSATRS